MNPDAEKQSLVVVLDGSWLCCNKSLWKELAFDEKTFRGFHFYDMDFSLAAMINGYRNYVLYDVLIEHQSAGDLDSEWLRAAKQFYRKWKQALPAVVSPVSTREEKELEFEAIRNYLILSCKLGYDNFRNRLLYWCRALSVKQLDKEHLRLLKMILKNP